MTLLEIEIDIDRNTTKKFTVSINDSKTKSGDNVSVFLPQTEAERTSQIKKDYVGRGRVFYTDGKISVAKDCPEWEK